MKKFTIDSIFILVSILAFAVLIFELSKIDDANTRLIKLADEIKFEKCLARNDVLIECRL